MILNSFLLYVTASLFISRTESRMIPYYLGGSLIMLDSSDLDIGGGPLAESNGNFLNKPRKEEIDLLEKVMVNPSSDSMNEELIQGDPFVSLKVTSSVFDLNEARKNIVVTGTPLEAESAPPDFEVDFNLLGKTESNDLKSGIEDPENFLPNMKDIVQTTQVNLLGNVEVPSLNQLEETDQDLKSTVAAEVEDTEKLLPNTETILQTTELNLQEVTENPRLDHLGEIDYILKSTLDNLSENNKKLLLDENINQPIETNLKEHLELSKVETPSIDSNDISATLEIIVPNNPHKESPSRERDETGVEGQREEINPQKFKRLTDEKDLVFIPLPKNIIEIIRNQRN